MHHLSSAACQTLVTKKLYSARPEFVGWSDTICDPHVPLRLCMSAVLTISRHMSPTVLAKTLYSAFSDLSAHLIVFVITQAFGIQGTLAGPIVSQSM